MKTLFITSLLLITSLSASTYDENYRVVDLNKSIPANDNVFMNGDFEKIIRFNMINMNDEDNRSAQVDEVVDQVKSFQEQGKDVKVTIIGHTNRATDDENERTIDSDTYANKIQNWFRYSLDTNSSQKISVDYAETIKEKLLDANLSKDILFVESRGGLDQGFTDATTEGRDLSNRVMVTLYVEKPLDIDSDRDGVFDKMDKCPNTPRGSRVDKYGCPIDSDGDGVLDYKDNCPDTPKGVAVDTHGCPLDSDNDGIVDYKDKCQGTHAGVTVDLNGCAIKSTLHLNFQTSSAVILQESYPEVEQFATFLKENPGYKAEIIGHTDSVGKAGLNMILSQERAASVKKALIADGVEESRLSTAGRGELDPIESNRTKEGRLANRRIEVVLVY